MEIDNQTKNPHKIKTYINTALSSFRTFSEHQHLYSVFKEGTRFFVTGAIVQMIDDFLFVFINDMNLSHFKNSIFQRAISRGILSATVAETITHAKCINSENNFYQHAFNLGRSATIFSFANNLFLTPITNFQKFNYTLNFSNYLSLSIETQLRTLGFSFAFSYLDQRFPLKSKYIGKFGRNVCGYLCGKGCEAILSSQFKKYHYKEKLLTQFSKFSSAIPLFLNDAAIITILEPVRQKILP